MYNTVEKLRIKYLSVYDKEIPSFAALVGEHNGKKYSVSFNYNGLRLQVEEFFRVPDGNERLIQLSECDEFELNIGGDGCFAYYANGKTFIGETKDFSEKMGKFVIDECQDWSDEYLKEFEDFCNKYGRRTGALFSAVKEVKKNKNETKKDEKRVGGEKKVEPTFESLIFMPTSLEELISCANIKY